MRFVEPHKVAPRGLTRCTKGLPQISGGDINYVCIYIYHSRDILKSDSGNSKFKRLEYLKANEVLVYQKVR